MIDKPRWQVLLDDSEHVVELDGWSFLRGAPRSFTADGEHHSLGGIFHRGRRLAAFRLGDHEATLELRYVHPRLATRYWRALLGTLRAGAWGAAMTMKVWIVYQLSINQHDYGAWVATAEGDGLQSWTYVAPGDALPSADRPDWPG